MLAHSLKTKYCSSRGKKGMGPSFLRRTHGILGSGPIRSVIPRTATPAGAPAGAPREGCPPPSTLYTVLVFTLLLLSFHNKIKTQRLSSHDEHMSDNPCQGASQWGEPRARRTSISSLFESSFLNHEVNATHRGSHSLMGLSVVKIHCGRGCSHISNKFREARQKPGTAGHHHVMMF